MIMDGFINLEKDPQKKILNQIAKEAILGIQAGINPGLLVKQLNSHVPFGKENAEYIYDYEMKQAERTPEQIKKDGEDMQKALDEAFESTRKTRALRKPGESDTLSEEEIDTLLKKVDEASNGKPLTIDELRKLADSI